MLFLSERKFGASLTRVAANAKIVLKLHSYALISNRITVLLKAGNFVYCIFVRKKKTNIKNAQPWSFFIPSRLPLTSFVELILFSDRKS